MDLLRDCDAPGAGVPIERVEAVLAPASFGWVLLQLHYDGRLPPVPLLDDVARLGWSVPAPPARPAAAIDWYTPDPITGERFTVRPWRAVHDIDPPGRQAGRAAWGAEDRSAALRALIPVLARHQVPVSSPAAELTSLIAEVLPAAARVADPAAAPAVVTFTAPLERAEAVDAFLRSTGLAYWTTNEVRTRPQRFRGSTIEVDVKVVVGEVVVRAGQADLLGARLRDEQAFVEVRPARPGDLLRAEQHRPKAVPPEPVPEPARPAVRLRVTLPVTAGPAVEELAGHPALQGVQLLVTRSARPEQVTYRGSSGAITRPCLLVELECPAEQAAAVRKVLADGTGVPLRLVDVIPTRP